MDVTSFPHRTSVLRASTLTCAASTLCAIPPCIALEAMPSRAPFRLPQALPVYAKAVGVSGAKSTSTRTCTWRVPTMTTTPKTTGSLGSGALSLSSSSFSSSWFVVAAEGFSIGGALGGSRTRTNTKTTRTKCERMYRVTRSDRTHTYASLHYIVTALLIDVLFFPRRAFPSIPLILVPPPPLWLFSRARAGVFVVAVVLSPGLRTRPRFVFHASGPVRVRTHGPGDRALGSILVGPLCSPRASPLDQLDRMLPKHAL